MGSAVDTILAGDAKSPLFFPAAGVAATWKDEAAVKAMSSVLRDGRAGPRPFGCRLSTRSFRPSRRR